MPQRSPTFTLQYESTDISQDVRPFLLAINYIDKLEGESDELEVAIENSDLRWLNAWLPAEGASMHLTLGYVDEASLGPITFEIDEPEFSGPPDIVRIKGLATPITASLRQRNTIAYENTTLRAIAQQIADKHDLQLVGDLPEFRIERATQKEQTDLEFLRETAAEYGLIFTIESSTRLVFFRESELEEAAAILIVARTEVSRYQLRRSAAGTYTAAEVSYQDPASGDFISAKFSAEGTQLGEEDELGSGDVLKIRERCESLAQAQLKAQEALRRANSTRVEGSLSLEGNILYSGGVNIALAGFGQFDGKYQVTQARHSLSKNRGYRTDAEIRKIEE